MVIHVVFSILVAGAGISGSGAAGHRIDPSDGVTPLIGIQPGSLDPVSWVVLWYQTGQGVEDPWAYQIAVFRPTDPPAAPGWQPGEGDPDPGPAWVDPSRVAPVAIPAEVGLWEESIVLMEAWPPARFVWEEPDGSFVPLGQIAMVEGWIDALNGVPGSLYVEWLAGGLRWEPGPIDPVGICCDDPTAPECAGRNLDCCWLICDGAGDCETNLCSDGQCSTPDKPDYSSCTEDGNLCTHDYCISGSCTHPDKECDDGDACNGVESCDGATGNCVPGTPMDCDDEDVCTVDSCTNGTCDNDLLDCDDGNVCNGTESCNPATGCEPGTPLDCDDGNECTYDYCDNGCQTDDVPDGTLCTPDSNPCTHDYCVNGNCSHPNVDDGTPCPPDTDPCTDDYCISGSCQHPNKDCTDTDACTINEDCDPDTGACISDPRDCDDGEECTTDYCDGGCHNDDVPDGTPCTPDTNPCTDDECIGGNCAHPNNTDPCNDEQWCTVNDVCSGGACSGAPRDCDDGQFCTGVETCNEGTDQCDSTDPCPPDKYCDEALDACVDCLSDAHCRALDDECNRGVCNESGVCVREPLADGTPCPDDGNECTDDECQSGACNHPPVPDLTPCTDDGNECTDDYCVAGWCEHPNLPPWTDCTYDADPCTWDHCYSGECVPSSIAECELCDRSTTDVCTNGSCVPATCTLGQVAVGGCPGDTVRADLPFGCAPPCFTGALSVNVSFPNVPAGWSVALAGSNQCSSAQPMPVDINIASDAGPATYQLSVYGLGPHGSTCNGSIAVTVLEVDLDGDADHDGVVEATDEDDLPEDQLPGVITLCNVDDDDGDANKDNEGLEATTIDGADDAADLAPVVLRAIPDLPTNWSVSLTLHTPTNMAAGVGADDVVRVFSATVPGADVAVILGPGTASMTLPADVPHDVDLTALRAGDITLGVEGLEFAGEVQLRLDLFDDVAALCASDNIQLKVAPLILLGHLDPPDTSFVSRITYPPGLAGESADYCTVWFPDATPSGVTDEVIPPTLNDTRDQWAQDEFQIGFQEAPYNAMYVLLDSKRDRGLNDFTTETAAQGGLFGPDFGRIQIDDGNPANTLDSFGNLEVSPPCTVGGTDYSFGRIYYGHDPNAPADRQMDGDLRAFLDRQQVQSPVALASDWLLVAHVDEFMSIVPDPTGTHGWKVLLVDTAGAVQRLDAVDPQLAIPRYRDHDWVDPQNPAIVHVVDRVGALLLRPVSDNQGMTIRAHNDPNGPITTQLNLLRAAIEGAFGLSATDFLQFPVLFDHVTRPSGSTGAVAITPDVVNASVYATWYLAPDPFIRQNDPAVPEEDANFNFILDPGEDLNSNGQLDTQVDRFQLAVQTNLPVSMPLRWLDDWNVYHLRDGEVHCSSNSIRTSPVSPKWWEVTLP